MSTYRPLTYASLQSVVQSLDPNLRLVINRRCRTIQAAEKALPLKIKLLQLEPTFLQINEATYKIGLIRQYKNTENPGCIQQENDDGGVQHDVDEFGCPIRNIENEARLNEENERIAEWEQQLARLKRDRAFEQKFANTPYGIEKLQNIDYQIKNVEARLLPFHYRRDNQQPPFTHFIQLTIITENGKRVERLEYKKMLYEAMQYFIGKFIKGKGNRVHVTTLKIDSNSDIEVNMFGLPENLKLRVHELIVMRNTEKVLNAIQPNIHEDSLPLAKLELHAPTNYTQQMIAEARKLVIVGISRDTVLVELLNTRVHRKTGRFTQQQIISLVDNWKHNDYDDGRYYSIGITNKKAAKDLFAVLKRRPDAIIGELAETRWTKFPNCIIIPMNYTSELNVHCEAVKRNNPERNRFPYTLKVKIQPNGYAYR